MLNGKLGVHALVFTDRWTAGSAAEVCRTAAEIGFDLVEVLVFDPATLDIPSTLRAARGAGVGLRLGMALGPATDISSPDPETAAAGEAAVARCLEIAAELGAPAVSGITYAAFNAYGAPPTPKQREQVVSALARLDRRAGELGVRLGLEPVNRYESYMVNTLDQAASMIRTAGGRNLFVHMDTFHMNIEEADIAGAVLRNSGLLGYVHLADNHRGLLGSGTFDIRGFVRALGSAGYDGDLTVESFSPAALSPDLVGAVKLWRTGWTDPVAAARAAFEVMRREIADARSALTPWG